MESHNLARINELAQIARNRELTDEEQKERQVLRENYLQAFRAQFRAQLDNTYVQTPDGELHPFGKRPK